MQVYAFIGPSGTGKSHHAVYVSQEYRIEMIIDDGLLIQGSRILAGISAKRAPTKIGAIKTALFSEETHAQEVKDKIIECNPDRILILGTSLGMTEKIAAQLNLPQPTIIINIEDVVSPESINKAKYIREHQGTHVVPAPTVEVKQRFYGNFFNPIRSFFQRKNPGNRPFATKHMWVEQTQVRPAFSSMGRFYIANDVIVEIVKHICLDIAGLDRVIKTNIENRDLGLVLHIDVSLIYGYFLPDVMTEAQKIIQEKIEDITSLNVISVDIHGVRLIMPQGE
ncbi:MAG: Asp23/Gls24 family envelope stress response protein [Dehalobacterium sp.]